jgi:hypothetical protein
MLWMTRRAPVKYAVHNVASTGTLCGLTRAIAVVVRRVVRRHRLVAMPPLLLLLLGSS